MSILAAAVPPPQPPPQLPGHFQTFNSDQSKSVPLPPAPV